MKIMSSSSEVSYGGKEDFEVSFEGSHEGRWLSFIKRSGDFIVSLGFE